MSTKPKNKFRERKYYIYKDRMLNFLKSPRFYETLKKTYMVLVLGILSLSFYHIGYARKVIPGVKIGDIHVGGMSFDEAVLAVSTHDQKLDKKLKLSYGGYEFEITSEDISLDYDVESTVSRAFDLGRSGRFFVDTKDKLASLVKTIKVKAFYDVDADELSNHFAKIRGEINQEAQNSNFYFEDGYLKVAPSVIGRKVNDQKMYDAVVASLEKINFKLLGLEVLEITPNVTAESLTKVYEEVNKIAKAPITVKFEDRYWVLPKDQLLDFVSVVTEDNEVDVVVNSSKLEAFTNMLMQDINELPRGRVSKIEDGIVVGFELIRDGQEMEVDKFSENFRTAFFNGDSEVLITAREIESLNTPSSYGIFSLLGEGTSTYWGSIPGRVHNLTLAAARTDGVLVPPGEIYSFNNSVGTISGVTGYDTAYIIANGRTVLGEGGGVCQTSTTLFRAVLNSGLPVIARNPHAYRVSYYEQDQPVGLDASIYQPSLDLQFKNDTPNYVLIQTAWDLNDSSLSFKIYGTPDGREVEISEPVVTNMTPPPEALYQDDPTLTKGLTKQIDWAAWGSNVFFTRLVKRGDEVLYEDTFRSNYQPWQAVFLVGTKEI